ncbi:MAG: bifunctional 4-hydroxy-2-oxoglutarate aldolase/2-dehydro-3-deoxy-phosphogluconate aldolase, partial [Pseudomonadota bacterium]
KSNDPARARDVMAALVAGGLPVIEVVLRTPRAFEVVETLAAQGGPAIVGVGTVLGEEHARRALEAGARFLVSPGLDDGVVRVASDAGVPVLPGVATATEAQRAWNMGLRHVKFFPAKQAGGVPMLKALASVFSDLRFMPTGGVGPGNLAEFLGVSSVLACGGSWLTPADAVKSDNDAAITQLAEEALNIARGVRNPLD